MERAILRRKRMERSDFLMEEMFDYASSHEGPSAKESPAVPNFEAWLLANPCPDKAPNCHRCEIDYCGFLAWGEIDGFTAE